MSDLMIAVLFSVMMVISNRFFPWMVVFEKGMPGLIMMTIDIFCVVIPFTGLVFSWGRVYNMPNIGAPANPYNWVIALWIISIADMITYFVIEMFNRAVTSRARAEAAEEEAEILRNSNLE